MLKKNQILKQNIRYILFADIYQKFTEPKTKRKAFAILESAIHCFDKKGFGNVTLTMIARDAGITRATLQYYFKDMDEIKDLSLKVIRIFIQRLGVEAMGVDKPANEMFKSYLDAHEYWAQNFPVHFRVWFSFLSLCSRYKKSRELNTKAVDAGTGRLVELFEKGRAEGVFFHKDDEDAARAVQATMLGWLIALSTEERPVNWTLSSVMKQQCMNIVLKPE